MEWAGNTGPRRGRGGAYGSQPAASLSWAGGGTGLVCVKFQRTGVQDLTKGEAELLLTLDSGPVLFGGAP